MPRARAIALIVEARRQLLSKASDHATADDARRLREGATELERLLLDVRAGRVSTFELSEPVTVHVTVSAD